MKNKGNKSSNIFQVLKSSGAWQSTDGSKPIIKDIGIKSPLNMNQKISGHKLSTGSEGDSPANAKGANSPLDLGLGTLAAGYGTYKAGQAAWKKGKELVGKAKQAYSDYKSGKSTREKTEADKKSEETTNTSDTKKKYTTNMKDFAIGSDERRAEYDRRGWAHDDTTKKKEAKADETTTDTPTPPSTDTAKEQKVKTDNVVEAKSKVMGEKEKKVTAKADLAAAAGKTKKADRLKNRAKRIADRKEKGTGIGNAIRKGVAKIRGKKGANKDAAVQAQVAANEAKEDSPATLGIGDAAAKAGKRAGSKVLRKAKKAARAAKKA